MKVLIVSTYDIEGGAARAAYRLHKSLKTQGIDSKMLVLNKSSDDYSVIGPDSKIQKVINKIRPFFDYLPIKLYKNRTKTLFSPSILGCSKIEKKINEEKPDLVHLHWICGGMLPIKDLKKINSQIVWNCHDMWPFTGGCHYDENCNEYRNNCRNCKVLNTKNNYLSKKVFNEKLEVYKKLTDLRIVGSSKWITECAQNSSLFQNKIISTLPNCIDTKLFKPISKALVKNLFNIPKNKKVILFGAMNSLSDPRKGAKELFESLEYLKIKNTIIVIAGSSKPENPQSLPFPVYFIPPLNDEISLPLMYNIADVIIVPSLQENLSNMVAESLSCGIPVVAFDIGGNTDMIDHKENGYLAKAFLPEDMASGIKWILENKNYKKLSKNARKKVLQQFDAGLVAKNYIKLYNEMVTKS